MKLVTAQALRAAVKRINAFTGVCVSTSGRYGRMTDSRDVSREVKVGHFTVPSEQQLLTGGLWYEIHESASCSYYGADRNEDWTVTIESRSSTPWTNCHGRTYASMDDDIAASLAAALNDLAEKARGIRRANKMLARGRCNPDQRRMAIAALAA